MKLNRESIRFKAIQPVWAALLILNAIPLASPGLARAGSSRTDECPKKYESIDEVLKEPLRHRAPALCDYLSVKYGTELGKAAEECAKIVRGWKQVKRVVVSKDHNPWMVVVYFDLKKITAADAPDVPEDRLEVFFGFPQQIPFYAMRQIPVGCK